MACAVQPPKSQPCSKRPGMSAKLPAIRMPPQYTAIRLFLCVTRSPRRMARMAAGTLQSDETQDMQKAEMPPERRPDGRWHEKSDRRCQHHERREYTAQVSVTPRSLARKQHQSADKKGRQNRQQMQVRQVQITHMPAFLSCAVEEWRSCLRGASFQPSPQLGDSANTTRLRPSCLAR